MLWAPLSKCHKLLEFRSTLQCWCHRPLIGQKAIVIFRRNNDIFGPCPVFNIIICQNHINLMYDKPIKWIHLGLQESSLINSDIYSCGFNDTIPPPVKQSRNVRFPWHCSGSCLLSGVAKKGEINLASSSGLCKPWLASLPVPHILEKGNKTKTRHLYTNPTSLTTLPRYWGRTKWDQSIQWVGSEIIPPGLKSWLYHLLVRARFKVSLDVNFLICKMRVILVSNLIEFVGRFNTYEVLRAILARKDVKWC